MGLDPFMGSLPLGIQRDVSEEIRLGLSENLQNQEDSRRMDPFSFKRIRFLKKP
jgi:hypothetical protein